MKESQIKKIIPYLNYILGISIVLNVIIKILLYQDYIYLFQNIKAFKIGSGIETAIILLILELIGGILLILRYKIYTVSIGVCIIESLMMYIIISASINAKYIFHENIFSNIYFGKEMFIVHLIYFNLSGYLAF